MDLSPELYKYRIVFLKQCFQLFAHGVKKRRLELGAQIQTAEQRLRELHEQAKALRDQIAAAKGQRQELALEVKLKKQGLRQEVEQVQKRHRSEGHSRITFRNHVG
jgi:hypothetical protein